MANIKYNNISRMSQLLRSTNLPLAESIEQSEILSKGYVNMVNNGIIKPVNRGMHVLLPLGYRVLDKLIKLIDQEMVNIGAQKILLPALTSTHLWKKTNRYEPGKSELFTLQDRYKKTYILSPTFEESICDMLSKLGPLSSKMLPLKLYQISSKWRDEMKPRLGLLRSREFIMKDLYTFDSNVENAKNTYDAVCDAYHNIFKRIGIYYIKAKGDAGSIGGCLSHEYHYLSEIGEDVVSSCQSCNYYANNNVYTESECPHCKTSLHKHNAIEIGHTFLLDKKYTEPLKAVYNDHNVYKPFVMGCFGIGLSRIMAAAVEILSNKEELRWPLSLAPYTVSIIIPKKGSKEEAAMYYLEPLCDILSNLGIDAILDDRTELTIGKRRLYTQTIGFPYAIILGKTVISNSTLELHDMYNNKNHEVTLEGIRDFFINRNNQEPADVLLQEDRS